MPCIQTKVNIPLTQAQEAAVKQKLGEAVALIPGKSENWLMLTFEDCCRMYFRGEKDAPMAFVEVKVFGRLSAEVSGRLTGAVTKILHDELGVAPDHIYVKYEAVDYWGWNGSNF